MRHSNIFTKTRKEYPSDEAAKNAQILIQAGYIYKEMAGVYAYMPFGLMVVENIKRIAREEMNAEGGQEIIMTALQKKETWEKTDRWSDEHVDIWFKSKLANGTDIGFGWSHEEPITEMMTHSIHSYKDLPIYVYQFQTKLRNELRAKSGIMRGREFVMKDLYSYSTSDDMHTEFYNKMADAYMRFYDRVGLGSDTFMTVATGGAFTKNVSHEFQTISDAGEDIIYIDRNTKEAYNVEALEDMENKEELMQSLEKVKAAEVGNIFSFGGEKSEKMGLFFMDADGSKKPVILGSYGIGITRVMGVIVEKYADDKGLVWPKAVAPYEIEIVSLFKEKDDMVYKVGEEIYASLVSEYSCLIDDRQMSIRDKMADADMLGMPVQIIIGPKTLEKGMVEVKMRKTNESAEIKIGEVVDYIGEVWNDVF
ncbi:MAG: aminoacyl--tRNA ligase-related protein [Patescibacteria group bacterium]